MEKLELTIPQELNDFESRILAKAVYHSSYVHQRAIAYWLGLAFIAIGGGIISLNFSLDATSLLAFAAIVAGATLQVTVFGYMMIPCQCGKRPVLTAQCRSHLIKQQDKRHVAMLLLGCLAVGFAWNWFIFGIMGSVGMSLGANAMIAIAVQCFQTTGYFVLGLGLVTFGSAALNKTEWLHTNRVIPEKDVQKAARLTEETADELHSLIDFHLRAGNISTAERLSQKLLIVVDSQHHC